MIVVIGVGASIVLSTSLIYSLSLSLSSVIVMLGTFVMMDRCCLTLLHRTSYMNIKKIRLVTLRATGRLGAGPLSCPLIPLISEAC